MLTVPEYRLIARAAQFPDPQPWCVLQQGMAGDVARAARAVLASKRILMCERGRGVDMHGRVYRRPVWRLHETLDIVVQIVAWVRSGQTTPPPWPREETRTAPVRTVYGSGSPEDRLLKAIIMNPGASWRTLAKAARMAHRTANAARSDLLARNAITIDDGVTHTSTGVRYPKSILVPNEECQLVRHFRKELRIEPTSLAEQRDPPTHVVEVCDWRDALKVALSVPPETEKRTEGLALGPSRESALKAV